MCPAKQQTVCSMMPVNARQSTSELPVEMHVTVMKQNVQALTVNSKNLPASVMPLAGRFFETGRKGNF